jgi:hypothetical protein
MQDAQHEENASVDATEEVPTKEVGSPERQESVAVEDEDECRVCRGPAEEG